MRRHMIGQDVRFLYFCAAIVFASVFSFPIFFEDPSDPNTALLVEGTSVRYDVLGGKQIHCGMEPDVPQCLEDYLAHSQEKKLAVLLGNSQLHAANNLSPEDSLVAETLHRSLLETGLYLVTISYGNANMREIQWAINEVLGFQEPSMIVIALVFDDFRELGLRAEMKKQDAVEDLHGKSEAFTSLGDFTESKISSFVDSTLIGKSRYEARYQTWVSLRAFRNSLLGITPSTKRVRLDGPYNDNLTALKEMLIAAHKKEIRVIGYIAPIRHDVPLPYDEQEYQEFKVEISTLFKLGNAKLYDLDSVVPGDAWGLKQSTTLKKDLEIDYMHFTPRGHQILSRMLHEKIRLEVNAI